ncbi:proline-rich transmembrane protein 1-like isoform X2 [Pecten maximus]|uniref:proline-rich transmembrane protein 1-like isoform X2 n=1 Tax=Pecten maximus TaxID=6579 RepID=UPI001458DC19|nr:proline-rich transmembrane protein 1-like isoform X2 [Pecten maximus]
MDQSAAAGNPVDVTKQPLPPQTGGPPPSYAQTNPSGQPPSGYVQSPYPGQPIPQQPAVQYGYPATNVIVTQPESVLSIPAQPYPRSHMALSVIGCLCCIWPLGIGAIIASSNVQSAITRGDIASAQKSSQTARIVNIINFSFGFLIILTVIIVRNVLVSTY